MFNERIRNATQGHGAAVAGAGGQVCRGIDGGEVCAKMAKPGRCTLSLSRATCLLACHAQLRVVQCNPRVRASEGERKTATGAKSMAWRAAVFKAAP